MRKWICAVLAGIVSVAWTDPPGPGQWRLMVEGGIASNETRSGMAYLRILPTMRDVAVEIRIDGVLLIDGRLFLVSKEERAPDNVGQHGTFMLISDLRSIHFLSWIALSDGTYRTMWYAEYGVTEVWGDDRPVAFFGIMRRVQ